MRTPPSPAVGDNSKNTFFFDNRVRAALRHDIMAALIDDTPFFVLTGPGGSGKTTLISRLVAILPNGIESIMISQTSHACRRFDDVLLRICQHIALEPAWSGHSNAEQIQRILEAIRNYLTQNGTRLLLILDQGEEASLAMLERVYKMLDAVNDGRLIMHLLLIGRENLLAELKRLRLAHAPEIPERYFTLPLLDDDDLPDFLRQWLTNTRPDIKYDAISRRGWQRLCAEAAGRPGHLTTLLDERIDALTSGQTEWRLDAENKTNKTKLLSARQKQKMFAGFSLTALAERLEDALLTPPGRRSQRPATDKGRRAAPRAMNRRFVNPTRLRRKNILFWGRLYRQGQRLKNRLAPAMTTISRAGAHTIKKVGRDIGQHRPLSLLGKTITAKIVALPPGILKKFVISLVAVWFVAVGVAVLWRGFSHVSLLEENKQSQAQILTDGSPSASVNEKDILPGEKPADQTEPRAEPEEQEIISGPAAGIATAATAVAPKAAVKPEPRPKAAAREGKKLKRPAQSREMVKITASKKKKKAAAKASKPSGKPIHIPRSKTVEKVKR